MATAVLVEANEVARHQYRLQQTIAARATARAREQWARIDPADIAMSWAMLVGPVEASVSASQRIAAGHADRYVDDVLDAGGSLVPTEARVVPEAFAGLASDGRALRSLLISPAFTALRSIAVGHTAREGLLSGSHALARIVRTQVADAGRVAEGVAITARPGVGYVRVLVPPSCPRCVILAGRRYKAMTAFLRHPRCDCRHMAATNSSIDDDEIRSQPKAYFDSLSKQEQDEIFGTSDARAIRDGADLNQVVNRRRKGMTSADGTTGEGGSSRGFAGRRAGQLRKVDGQRYRRSATRRLTPERIYLEANGNRDVALSLLRQHGYLAA